MRYVDHVMGTIVSLDVRDPASAVTLNSAVRVLHDADARFSPYRPDSELSRLIRGEFDECGCSAELRQVMALADDLCRTSDGYFDVRRHRPDGRLDPSGLVKGWATENAAHLLDEAGLHTYCLNVGGDVIARGSPEKGRGWRVGIRHPRDVSRLAAVLAVRDLAVATSGAYERGDHIWDPHTGVPAADWTSVTVVGPSLTYADAYATAAFAMGRRGIAWVAAHPGYGAYAIDADEQATWTATLDELLVPRLDAHAAAVTPTVPWDG
ncbi:MAG: FAD:protein FMN transferase [Candidatus Limnocylindrales bacterium]